MLTFRSRKPSKGRQTALAPVSGLPEKRFCNLLELNFSSNTGNSLISPALPLGPWSGAEVSFIEKTSFFLPGLVNKPPARKPPSSAWPLSWSGLSPANENKCINISGTYRKQFCWTPAANGRGVYMGSLAGARAPPAQSASLRAPPRLPPRTHGPPQLANGPQEHKTGS